MQGITITDIQKFDEEFGTLGLKVNPRTGANKRTQDDKEWYVIRVFLKCALMNGRFQLPLKVCKQSPPAPDFMLSHRSGAVVIEITEATSEADQRDMTLSERRNEPSLLGSDGGRFPGGIVGDQAERVFAADVLRAILRKRSKSVFLLSDVERHLVIYPNSPIFISLDKEGAFGYLKKGISCRRSYLASIVRGCKIHVICENAVVFDVLASS